jgi:hypothetical protein
MANQPAAQRKKLNPNARKWVKALRSGKYEQTTHQLKSDEGYCCLGVACEVAVSAGVIKGFDGNKGALPPKVKQWLGLSTVNGKFSKRRGGYSYLITENDNHRKSFSEIADIIESQPEGLFMERTA